ncbi:MAG: N-acetylmuramoyl-L-alanine amidase [Microvirga sp.]
MRSTSLGMMVRLGLLALMLWGGAARAASEDAFGPPVPTPSATPAPPAETRPAIAADVVVEADGPRTRFKITLSRPVVATARLMERPDRIIVDLPELSFHLPPETGRKREGVIASYRYGLFAPGQSRIVIDLAQTANVSEIRLENNAADGTSLMTIELTRVDRDEFRRVAADGASKAQGRAPAPAVAAAADRDNRPLIVLDPGHGGVDPGAASLVGTVEKDIVLAFAQLLKKRLEATNRYRVFLTRGQDVFLPLEERVRFAQAHRADLFVSIHADSISGAHDVRGMTVYTRADRASDADAARLAERENKADAVAGVDTAEGPDEVLDILQDLTLRETRAFSHGFAAGLVNELDPVARLNKNARREARFWVLRAHDVPSVLLELGYLSSRRDYDLLVSDEWRAKATLAISGAIDRFFATRLAKQGPAAVLP